MLSCTAVRVSTRFGSELSIRAVGQYRFAIRACRTTANRCCRITFQPTTTHFSFRKRGIHSIASPLANRMSAKKIAETGRRQDTLDACSFSYPAYAPDGLSSPFPELPWRNHIDARVLSPLRLLLRSGPISIQHSSIKTIPQKAGSHTAPKGFANILLNTD